MLAFASFSAPRAPLPTHRNAEDLDLDLGEDGEPSGSRLAMPGEPITSAQAFMRCVRRALLYIAAATDGATAQRTRDVY